MDPGQLCSTEVILGVHNMSSNFQETLVMGMLKINVQILMNFVTYSYIFTEVVKLGSFIKPFERTHVKNLGSLRKLLQVK